MRTLVLCVLVATLGLACVDSEKVSWIFISSTGVSTGSGGAVLIVRKTTDAPLGGDAFRIEVEGIDQRGLVTVHLATLSDTAILEYGDRIDISSPMLDHAVTELKNAQFVAKTGEAGIGVITVTDASDLDSAAFGLGRLHIATRGSALVLEHQGGVIAYSLGESKQFYPDGSTVETSGTHLAITTPQGRTTTALPGWSPTEKDRIVRNKGWIRLLGPRGELTATLPENQVQFGAAGSGIYLKGEFPAGVSSTDTTPVELIAAEFNRHLLRIEEL